MRAKKPEQKHAEGDTGKEGGPRQGYEGELDRGGEELRDLQINAIADWKQNARLRELAEESSRWSSNKRTTYYTKADSVWSKWAREKVPPIKVIARIHGQTGAPKGDIERCCVRVESEPEL